MELKRFFRILRSRWYAIAIVAVLGAAVAIVLTTRTNNEIKPVWRAVAPLTYPSDPADKTGRILDNTLRKDRETAMEVNRDLLRRNPLSTIDSSSNADQLQFIGVHRRPDVAESIATEMRANFAVTKDFTAEARESLVDVEQQLREVQNAIAEIDAREDARLAQIDLLADRRARHESIVSTLETDIVNLLVERVTADEERIAEIDVDVELKEAAIAVAESQLSLVPDDPEPNPDDELDRSLLVDRETRLKNDYGNLLGEIDTLEEYGSDEPVELFDDTPEFMSRLTNGAIGLGAGVLFALVGLILSDRLRRPVWTARDTADVLPAVAGIPPRPGRSLDRPWYPAALPGARKAGIQTLRTAVDAVVSGGPISIGITGMRSRGTPAALHELGADLAASLAVAGYRVLLIDADPDRPSDLPEFASSGFTLSDVLRLPVRDVESTTANITRDLGERKESLPGLLSMRFGMELEDAVDALSGPQFATLMSVAKSQVDAVIVVAPDVGHAMTDALAQRLDYLLIACMTAKTTLTALADATSELSRRHAKLLGSVLLGRSARTERTDRVVRQREDEDRGVFGIRQRRSAAREEPVQEAPMRRLPEVGVRVAAESDSDTEVEEAPAEPVGLDVPSELSPARALEWLVSNQDQLDPARVQRAAVDYLSVEILGLLGHVTDGLKPDVDPSEGDDVIPITPGLGAPTVLDRLRAIFARELGVDAARELELDLAGVLGWKPGDEQGRDVTTMPLERWIEIEFFRRHASQFKRRPVAWHLSSPRGAFQILTYYPVLNKRRLKAIRSRVVKAHVGALEEAIEHGRAENGSADVGRLEQILRDVQAFDAQLDRLLSGADPDARIWVPWKDTTEQPNGWDPDPNDGVRANLAPLQRLGLLPVPVLADRDMKALTPPNRRRAKY